MTHTVDITLQFFVGIDRHLTDKIVVTLDIAKGVVTSEFRITGCLNQMTKYSPL